VSGSCF